jgi:hypothetical protein
MKQHLIELAYALAIIGLAVAAVCLAILPSGSNSPARGASTVVVGSAPVVAVHHDRWIDLKDYCNRDPLGHKGKQSVIRRFDNRDDADRVFLRWDETGIRPVTFGFICEIWEIHVYKGGRHWRMAAHIDFR